MTPDPERDVMVYRVAMLDALSGASIGDRWTVWIGRESEGSFDSESDAVLLATELANDNGRPAWLVKEGGAPIAL
jgi:hypothetical protein